MPVTIRDVAARAKVSPSTVSRTIRNSSSISQKTQERVRLAMAELGYKPPVVSESAKEGSTLSIIGILLPPAQANTYDNPFFLEVIRGISSYAIARGALCSPIAGKDDQEVIDAIREIQKQPFPSTFIVLFSRENDPVVEYLYSEGIDYVQIGHPWTHLAETVCVDNDNLQAGYDAAAHLHGLGHTKIAFFGSPDSEMFAASRRRGYRMFMNEHHLERPDSYSISLEQTEEDGMRQLADLIDPGNPDRPTALIVSDDFYAVRARQLCVEKRVAIPQDLSLISFNNSIFSQLTDPAITSIDINTFQLGVEATSLAINHLENPGLMASRTIVPYQLMVKDSCMDLRRGCPETEEQ